MKKINLIIGLVIIAAVGYGLFFISIKFYYAMLNSSSEVVAAIIGAMATVIGGIAAIIINQRNERIISSEEAHRIKKVEIYQEFIEKVAALLGGNNENLSIKAPEEGELTDYVFHFKSKLLLWGSPQVISAYLNFEAQSSNKEKVLSAANNLYAAIRKDIGLSNAGLRNNEFIKLYLRPDERENV